MTTIFEIRDFNNFQNSQLYATLNGVAAYFRSKGVDKFWTMGPNDKLYFDMSETGLQDAIDFTKSYLGNNTKTSIRYSIEIMPGMVFDEQYLLGEKTLND